MNTTAVFLLIVACSMFSIVILVLLGKNTITTEDIPFPSFSRNRIERYGDLQELPALSSAPWLRTFKFKPDQAYRGKIHDNFQSFPMIQTLKADATSTDPYAGFEFAINIANQSGPLPFKIVNGGTAEASSPSLCEDPMTFWVSICAGSPPLVLAHQEVPPGEGFQFCIDFSNERLISKNVPKGSQRLARIVGDNGT